MPRESEPKERIEIGPLGCTIPAYKDRALRPAYNVASYNQYVRGEINSHGEIVNCTICGGSHAGKK